MSADMLITVQVCCKGQRRSADQAADCPEIVQNAAARVVTGT